MRWIVVIGDYDVPDAEYTYVGPFRSVRTATRLARRVERHLMRLVGGAENWRDSDLFISIRPLQPASSTLFDLCDPWAKDEVGS